MLYVTGKDANIQQITRVSEPLHFEFRRAVSGRAIVRTKLTLDQEQWSESFLPLKCADNRIGAPVAKF